MEFVYIYEHVVMHVKFHQGVISYRGVIALCLNFNDFSVVGHNFVSNGWNLMKLILNIYDYGVVMHVRFHQGVVRYKELLPFDFFHPQP